MEDGKIQEIAAKWAEFMEQAEVVDVPIYDLKPSNLNPRRITDSKYVELMKDITHDPEFMRQRPVLAYRHGKRLIIYAGHQRWRACIELGWETIPVSIDENLDEATMKNRMVLDNLYYGDWDKDLFGSFDDDILKELDLMSMEGLQFEEFMNARVDDKGMDKGLKNRRKDRAENEEVTEAGKHYFNLIFSTEEEREEFNDFARNWGGDGRFEDKLIKLLHEQFKED